MASKNGGRSTDDERPEDDEPVDELEDDLDEDDEEEDDLDEDDDADDLDEDDEDEEDEEEDDLEDLDAEPVAAGASRSRDRASASKVTSTSAKAVPRSTKKDDVRPNIFSRFINFVREVVAELQKVIWPTRKELLTYTTVVVVFVAIMMTFVAGLDYGFARLMFFVFGNKTTD